MSEGVLHGGLRRAPAFGRLSPKGATMFSAMGENAANYRQDFRGYIDDPSLLPVSQTAIWFVV